MCEILLLIITLTIRYQLNRFFVLLDLYELLINNTLGGMARLYGKHKLQYYNFKISIAFKMITRWSKVTYRAVNPKTAVSFFNKMHESSDNETLKSK